MMVIFEAIIKNDGLGGWFIELNDTVSNNKAICKNVKELEEKVEDFGSEYGGHVDEIKWIKDDDVSEQCMNEIRIQMEEYRDLLNQNQPNV
jgi:hypothetical protein